MLVPITAIRRHDGVVEVRNGQRRTVAACKVGLTTVPVYVLAATAADTAAETIDRVVHQMVTNDQTEVPPALLIVWGIDLGFCGSWGVGY